MRKITDAPLKKIQGYSSNEAPYHCLVKWVTKDKSEKEKQELIKKIQNSYTYYYICENGSWSVTPVSLYNMFMAEQKSGLLGFLIALSEESPITILPYIVKKSGIDLVSKYD